MVAVWPAGLPQSPLLDGFREAKADGRRFSSTDTGPGKVFRKTSTKADGLNLSFLMTAAQRVTFETFYSTTLNEGALPFDFPDYRSAGTLLLRFRVSDSYNWTTPDAGVHYLVRLPLEVLP